MADTLKLTVRDVYRWRDAALADGWGIAKLYNGESILRAGRLTKGDWLADTIARPGFASVPEDAEITVRAPDLLRVRVPVPYSWPELVRNTQRCMQCGAHSQVTWQSGEDHRACPQHVRTVDAS